MRLWPLLDAGVAFASVPVLAATGYLGYLALRSREVTPPPSREPHLRFDVVVPAHDEEAGIAETVKSLLAIDYPRSLFRVVVVADNCSDATAARAREAGAVVLERFDEKNRGKGHALAHAFEKSLAGDADAVVVVDADTTVSENLLRAFAAHLDAGEMALQAEYGVRNPDASWRTRLMVIAMSLFHDVRSRARERMDLSCGLRGNGMAFARELLEEVPHDAFSIVEDVEYGLRLAEAGHRVGYVGEASVLGEMVSSGEAARSQRLRWEAGRQALRKRGLALLVRGIAERDAMLFDLGLDVVLPPLSKIAVATVAVGAAAGLVAVGSLASGRAPIAWIPAVASGALLGVYVARGVQLSGLGARGVATLAWAPVYVVWKATLGRQKPSTWVRTRRET
ncbi:MAG TPA: glycosyltransferase family 2 protein [Polyangiaceae bacterium]|jgi:GT2 family glycosyltransferase